MSHTLNSHVIIISIDIKMTHTKNFKWSVWLTKERDKANFEGQICQTIGMDRGYYSKEMVTKL